MIEITHPQGAVANDINKQSAVIGVFRNDGGGFVWANGTLTNPFGQSTLRPFAISNSGAIIYNQQGGGCSGGMPFAGIWKNGSPTTVAPGPAAGINDFDLGIANISRSGGDCPGNHVFGVLTDGTALTPFGVDFTATAINNKRQVAGNWYVNGFSGGGVTHATIWENGVLKDLGTLGGASSRATSINNFGEVVGMSQTAAGVWRPFIYSQGTMIDLSQRILNSTLLEIKALADINDSGHIVGTASLAAQPGDRAVLLRPAASDLTPSRGGNTGSVTVRAVLPGMMTGLTAKLSTATGPDIIGTNTIVAFGILTTTFDLRGVAAGKRDFVITNPDLSSTRLVDGFSVEQGGAAVIRVSKTGTRPVPGRVIDYFITVENMGNVNANQRLFSEYLEPWFTLVSASPAPDEVLLADDLFPASDVGIPYKAAINWKLDSLAPGEIRVLAYRATLDSNLPLGTTVRGGGCFDDLASKCRKQFLQDLTSNSAACVPLLKRFPPSPTALTCLEAAFLVADTQFRFCLLNNLAEALKCAEKKEATVTPVDPNEKLTSHGKFILSDQTLTFPIHYENIGNAEAKDVFITDVLDPNLDTKSLQVLTQGAMFDESSRTLKWSLLDRNLPPKGTDNVVLSIKPKSNLPSGTIIRNKASIQFEVFAPLITNETVNIIDSTSPVCNMNPLPAQTTLTTFPVSWITSDAVGEVAGASVFVGVNNGPFTVLVQNTKDSSVNYTGSIGNKYSFYCTAVDTVGNAEVQSPVAEATTTVISEFALTTAVSPAASGTITAGGAFPSGALVPIIAAANPGYVFSFWSGACAGSGTCSVTMDAAKTVTANFVLISSLMSVNQTGPLAVAGATQTMVFRYTHTAGFGQLGVVNALINQYLDGNFACYVAYSQPLGVLYLVNDQGPGSGLSAGLVLGGSGSVSNGQCTINGPGSSAVGSGSTLTLTLNVTYKQPFLGNKVIYAAAQDQLGNSTGWSTMGATIVPETVPPFPRSGTMTPSTGTTASTVFSFTYADALAASNLQTNWALISDAIDGRKACYVAYYLPGNLLYLYPDNGDGSLATTMVLTGSNTIENSQCRISAQGSSATSTEGQLTVKLNITFKAPFAGFKAIWTATQTLGGAQTSAWKPVGGWLVP